MKIAIYGRPFNDISVLPYIQQIFDVLNQYNVEIYLHKQLADFLEGKIKEVKYDVLKDEKFLRKNIDVLITLGGDGTLLDMVTLICSSGTPVIGINFGRLGFLASVNKNDIAAAIYAVVNKDFTIDSRELLEIDCEGKEKIFSIDNFALVYDFNTNQGNFVGQMNLDEGSELIYIPSGQRNGWHLGGLAGRPNNSIPNGYGNQLEGECRIPGETAAKNTSWGVIKSLYR